MATKWRGLVHRYGWVCEDCGHFQIEEACNRRDRPSCGNCMTLAALRAEVERLRSTRADSAKLIRSSLANAIGEMMNWKNGISTSKTAAYAVVAVLEVIDHEIAALSTKGDAS